MSAAAQPSLQPASQGPVAVPSSGGATSGRFCLNTDDEVSQALGVEVARSEGNENAGFGGGCLYYDAAGTLVYSIGVVPVTPGLDLIATGLLTPGAVEVSGIGERAVLISAAGPLVYKQGNWNVTTGGTLDPDADPTAYRTALETLARASAARANF